MSVSRRHARLLDDAGLHMVEIFASGGLDEYAVAGLLASGAPIDGFGVGTSMGVSSDAASLDIAYKLCEYAGEGRLKLAAGKPVLPGRKQVFRRESAGQYAGDTIARYGEHLPGRPLLERVMGDGKRLSRATSDLDAIRDYAREQIARLPLRLRQISEAAPPYPVEVSNALSRYQLEITREVESSNG